MLPTTIGQMLLWMWMAAPMIKTAFFKATKTAFFKATTMKKFISCLTVFVGFLFVSNPIPLVIDFLPNNVINKILLSTNNNKLPW